MKESNTPSRAPSLKPAGLGSHVHIWQIGLDRKIKEVQHLSIFLSPSEHTRASRFHFALDGRRYTVARAMLRLILCKYLHTPPDLIALSSAPYGKPELANANGAETGKLQFNLSHSGDMAVYVIARGRRVGVDIERVRQEVKFEPLVTRYFSLHEQAAFQRFPKSKRREAFFRMWVLKEAYLKARGDGLSIPLESFSVEIDKEQANGNLGVADDPDESTRWTLTELNLQAGYAAALAVEGHGWDMEMFGWESLMQAVSW